LSTVAGAEIVTEAASSEPKTDPKTGNSVSVSAEIPTAESYGINDDGTTIELDLTPKAIDADQEQVAAAVQGQGTVKQIGGALDISLVLKDTEGNTEKLTTSEPITLTVSIALSDEDRERIKQGTHTLKILHQIVDGLEDLGGDYDPYADTIEITFTTSHFGNFFVTLVGDDPTPAVETPSTVTETPAATTVAAVSDIDATSTDGTTLAATGDAFGALTGVFAGIAAAAVALLGALIWRRRKMQL
jgi:LPXTG-motif cell wall-anchored protein